MRRPGTQSVCLRPNLGSNRPEKWLSRFLVPDQTSRGLGPPQAPWGRSDINPRLLHRSSIPAHFTIFSDCPRLRVEDRIGAYSALVEQGYIFVVKTILYIIYYLFYLSTYMQRFYATRIMICVSSNYYNTQLICNYFNTCIYGCHLDKYHREMVK